ncbi:site-specific integrase [Pseudomonas sp. REB1044]|uniref:tyrosine-type recombinase/integrase n=1 Tax=Pseudomonas sp. REB1044 TaxID=2675224 RepID=UPI00315CB093
MNSVALPGRLTSFAPPLLIAITKNGKKIFALASNDKVMDDFFESWCAMLSQKKSFRTVKAYAGYNRVFLELLQLLTHLHGELTAPLLSEIIENYENFLVFGTSSEHPMIAKAARIMGDRNLSGSSVGVALAALNSFVAASERFRLGLLELEAQGYIKSKHLSGFSLAQAVKIETTSSVRSAIKKNSWLAGCLAGGARRIKRAGLSAISKPSALAYTDNYGGDEYAFPIDRCKELIESAPSARDKMLWSLLAATGARISEALTMLNEDVKPHVDPGYSRIVIIDPDTRRNALIKYLSASDIDALPHKGRAHTETFMIEPFASMFWIALEEYKAEIRAQKLMAPVRHEFLVRNLVNGEPMHSSYQALYERFRKAAFDLTQKSYGFHSLRHMYGYYLVNHCPNPNPHSNRRYGFELSLVQQLMGHALIKTTRRYARQDAHLLQAALSAANFARLSGGPKTMLEARIAYHQQEIKQLQQLALEAV